MNVDEAGKILWRYAEDRAKEQGKPVVRIIEELKRNDPKFQAMWQRYTQIARRARKDRMVRKDKQNDQSS